MTDLIEPKIIEDGIELALQQVAKEPLAFHNVDHTRSVIHRFERIIAFLKKEHVDAGPERALQLGKLGAAFHDTVQDFTESTEIEQETADGAPNPFAGHEKIMRKRATIDNERASAERAIAYMREVNKTKPNTFTAEDEDTLRKQVDMTIPDFDPEAGTVIQPRLDEHSPSSVIERALALADLGTAGMEDPETFVSEGSSIFREENMDIRDALYAQKQGLAIDPKNKEYYRYRMLKWSRFQPVFAAGRKNMLNKEIGCFPETVQQKLKEEIFARFDASIEAATEAAERRAFMTFEEIARDMGYKSVLGV